MKEEGQQPGETDRVEAILTALGGARPDGEFEQRTRQRLLRRMQTEGEAKASAPSRAWLAPARVATASALVVCALCFGMRLVQRAPPTVSIEPHAAGSQEGQTVATILVPRRQPTSAVPAGDRKADVGAVRGMPRTKAVVRGQVARDGAEEEASFPAPPMPLTEQERLLLQLARRNDPVEVAMLDPVERELKTAREQAETARFFTPPPLPKEIREQVVAALRSQYVNTDPPDEKTLEAMANRSTP